MQETKRFTPVFGNRRGLRWNGRARDVVAGSLKWKDVSRRGEVGVLKSERVRVGML